MKTLLSLLACVIFSQINAQEWANVARFKEENERIIADNAPVKLVFIGNSITEGWKSFDPNLFGGTNYINRGISGQTTPQMLIRFKQDVLDLNPKGVVILAGTNDIAGNTGLMSVHPNEKGYEIMKKVLLNTIGPSFK